MMGILVVKGWSRDGDDSNSNVKLLWNFCIFEKEAEYILQKKDMNPALAEKANNARKV